MRQICAYGGEIAAMVEKNEFFPFFLTTLALFSPQFFPTFHSLTLCNFPLTEAANFSHTILQLCKHALFCCDHYAHVISGKLLQITCALFFVPTTLSLLLSVRAQKKRRDLVGNCEIFSPNKFSTANSQQIMCAREQEDEQLCLIRLLK